MDGNVYISHEDIYYVFIKNMDFKYVMDSNYIELDIEKVDKKAVINDIKTFLSPIIEAQPKPKINLQWLFNFICADDFK